MGFITDIGDLQGNILPDPEKPLTFESLVDQYIEQAKEACRETGRPEWHAPMLAEIWADVDMDIFRWLKVAEPEKTDKELLQMFGIEAKKEDK